MDMIERVARALHEVNDRQEHEHFRVSWDAAVPRYRELVIAEARAAIEAMRSVDNEMLEAMHNAMFAEPFDGTNLPMLGAGFEAAIDAALNPETPK